MIVIDRITIDASAVKDNLYVGSWKTTESHLTATEKTTAVALTDADGKTLVYLSKTGGVPLVRTAINAGAIVTGGQLTINGATIKGYQHTQGNGTAIGSWGGAKITINKDSVVIGGAANSTGSKALFGTENDFGAISNLGQGGVIAMGAGSLTINGGEFKTYEGITPTKHGGLIAMNGGTDARSVLTITDGTFYGPDVTTYGACINHSYTPVTISGGTFFAGKAEGGGVIRGSGKLTITGGKFEGTGNADAAKQCNYGGIVYNNGSEVSITGGEFNNGWDRQGGWNMYFTVGGSAKNKVYIGGEAKIAGEVLLYGTDSARVELTVGDKAIIDSTLCSFGRGFNIRALKSDVYLKGNTTPLFSTSATTKLSLTHDTDGNVNNVVAS